MSEARVGLELPVSDKFLSVAANFVRAAALEAGFDEDAVEAIEIASMEAVENVIDHSRLGGDGRLKIEAGLEGDGFVVQIRDRGIPWPREVLAGKVGRDMPPPESPRGRGLAMMHALMDEVVPMQGNDGEKILRLIKRRPPARNSASA